MPTRPLLLILLMLTTLGWVLVTRNAFEGPRRRSSGSGEESLIPVQPRGSGPLTKAPREPVRLALDRYEPDDCFAVLDPTRRWCRLMVQCGRELISLDLRSGGPQIDGQTELPETSYVWNVAPGRDADDDGILSLGSAAVQHISRHDPQAALQDVAETAGLFRGSPTRASRRTDFTLVDGASVHFVSPELDELRWMRLDQGADRAEEVARLPTSALAQQILGYGLADSMSCRLSVPFFRLGPSPSGPSLLFQRDDRLLRYSSSSGEMVDVGHAPRGGDPETRKILGFDHRIPPLSEDWDGDGELDVLFTIPGEGKVLAYGSARRGSVTPGDDQGPDQTLVLSGWILHRWLIDGDHDGRADLVLLEVPKLGMLGQVSVLHSNRMFGSLTLRRQLQDGRFDPSPLWSESFDLPISISLRRKQRSIRFPAPVAPLLDPRDGLLLLLPDASGPILGKRDETGFEVLHRFRPLAEDWVVDDPFQPTFAQLDGVGGLDLAWIERPPAPGAPRLIVHRLP